MSAPQARLSPELLVEYCRRGAVPRREWRVGMEVERMGRRTDDGQALTYDGEGPTVRGVLEFIHARRGGQPVLEGGRLVGLEAAWGSISLEPGGQVEWSSTPARTLDELQAALEQHLAVLREAGTALGIRWLEQAVDPALPLQAMAWMPKERYRIMRDYYRGRGRLAQRMMTQTASIQCAFDFEDPADWARRFRAAALLAPVATALFANSSRVDGAESGFRSFRQAIWRETDDDRCGLPPRVFEDGFDLKAWVDWVLDVPLLFRQSGQSLTPPDGSTFRRRLAGPEGALVSIEDWVTHCSTIFTEVRCYTYIEVRSADLQPEELIFAVPAFWTGMLYDDASLDLALDLGRAIDHGAWRRAMDSAARHALDGTLGALPLREVATRVLGQARRALLEGAPCAGDGRAARHLERLAAQCGLEIR